MVGVFPYWEWGLDCNNMLVSPVFDGSEYSIGSNGDPSRTGATGGGCLKKGTPFANFTVNIGPMGAANPLKYNPRCIKRDLSTAVCKSGASFQKTTNAILISKDIKTFQAVVQGEVVSGVKQVDVGMGVHSGGHYSIAGDPGSDTYFSPLEPGFYLHHGNIDRMHFIWQNLDWDNRQVCSPKPIYLDYSRLPR
jgi:tyrosinase